MQNALTVDVEDYFQVAAFANNVSVSSWDSFESRVETNTIKLLDLFDLHKTKATFFVLGWVAERNPDLVIEIHSRGHEVACHGYSHQSIYKQDVKTFMDETKKAKDLLEDIINHSIDGYRAASYSITKKSLWALDVLTDLGFTYDSSIVPVHHDLYGIPDAPRNIHTVAAPNGKQIIEFPPTTLALPGANLPVSGGGYFRLYPLWFSKVALKWVNKYDKMPFIFYLHPWEVDSDQPRIKCSWFSKFRHYNNLSKCYARLDNLLDEFEFTTVQKILTDQKFIHSDALNQARPIVAY